MEGGLLDRIYESAFVPELWTDVLAELADIAGARSGILFLSNGSAHQFTASSAAGFEALTPVVESGWIWRCERFRRFMSMRHAGFLPDSSIYTEEEKRNDPFYTNILYPRGLGMAAGTVVPLPTGDLFAISVERENASGPIGPAQIKALDALRPHVARAAVMAARLQLEHAQTIEKTLVALGLAALVLDDRGRVVAANDRATALTGAITWRAHGKIALADKAADALLQEALATIRRDGHQGVRSFPLRDPANLTHLVAHFIPIRRSARDVFALSAAVLVLTPVTRPDAAPVELVQSLFDFTPAEARVARGLADGLSVAAIARAGGVSANTVRTQVRGVLEKTGCGRQVDVVALLTMISASFPHQN